MTKRIYLVGAGDHGKVVLDTLLGAGLKVSGILDEQLRVGTEIFGVAVAGGDELLAGDNTADVTLVNGLGANPHTHNRKTVFEAMKSKGFDFHAVVHGSAIIGRECRLEEGCQIMAGAVLQNRVHMGANAVANTRASIDHDCVIGAHAFIAPGAVLCGNITVAEAVFIGAGAVVMPGLKIGAGAIVGAGAVVTQDVPEGWVVAGNPAMKLEKNKQ